MPQRKWDRKTIKKMQGLADDIRSGHKPSVDPKQWLVKHCGLGLHAIRCLIRGRQSNGARPEVKRQQLHADFAAAYSDLAEACSRQYAAVIEEIALEKGNTPSDRMKAAKWAAEATYEERYGEKRIRVETSQEPHSEPQASDADPAVWDEMNDDEAQQLDVILKRIKQDEDARDKIIAGVKKRIDALDSW